MFLYLCNICCSTLDSLHYYDHYLKDGAPSILLQDDNFAGVRAVVNHGVIVIPATEIQKL